MDRPDLLQTLTVGVGSAWALLAAAKFFGQPFLPQLEAANLLPVYYLAMAVALANFVEWIVACIGGK